MASVFKKSECKHKPTLLYGLVKNTLSVITVVCLLTDPHSLVVF